MGPSAMYGQRTLVLVNLASITERADKALLPAVYREVGAALHATPTGLGALTLYRSIMQAACYPVATYTPRRATTAPTSSRWGPPSSSPSPAPSSRSVCSGSVQWLSDLMQENVADAICGLCVFVWLHSAPTFSAVTSSMQYQVKLFPAIIVETLI
jgi:hypothetical protein